MKHKNVIAIIASLTLTILLCGYARAYDGNDFYPNLLKNAGFENDGWASDDADYWESNYTFGNGFRSTGEVAAHTGSWVYKLNDGQQWGHPRQWIMGNYGGKIFRASVWAKYKSTSFNNWASLSVAFRQNGINGGILAQVPNPSHFFLTSADPCDTWKYEEVTLVAPAGTDTVELKLMTDSSPVGTWPAPEPAHHGTIYFDDAYLGLVDSSQDINDDNNVNFKDLVTFAGQWLVSHSIDDIQATRVINNFESYAAQSDLVGIAYGKWYTPGWAATAAVCTLLTNPADCHGGGKAMRWQYNLTDYSGYGTFLNGESMYAFPSGSSVNLSLYDQLHIWINRHSGNSGESLLFVKFMNGGWQENNIGADAWYLYPDGSSYNPVGWTEWVVDLHKDLRFNNLFSNIASLTNVKGFIIGIAAKESNGGNGMGSGTIDFDDISLTDATKSCSPALSGDFNNDCVVNFADFAMFAEKWLFVVR